ncbi:MAG: respiratory nitrate reductase subunit gamma [Candidatus Angelobacter sp.]
MTTVLFVVFPYVAVFLAIFGGIYRYFSNRFTYSALSSQMLESRQLFWGSVSWHYGIVLILLAHLLAFLFPGVTAAILGTSYRLVLIEIIGLSLGLYALVGIVILIARRLPSGSPARVATSPMDWILLFVLLIQVLSGVGIALADRWGSLWYLSNAVPWLWSLVRLSPDPAAVAPLSLLVKLHILNGFVVILLFPFSRLVHLVSFPIQYLWRPYQVVIWNLTPRRPRLATPLLQPAAAFAGAKEIDGHSDSSVSDFADPSSDREVESPSRRRLLARISIAAGSLAAAIVALPSVAFLLGLRKPQEVWRAVGSVNAFEVGKTVEVAFLDSSPQSWAGVTAQTAAWLRRVSEQQFIAFSLHCTHLGCPVRWLPEADLFMCPCHGGVFYNDGRVASGPPRRALVRYPVRVQAGQVEILTSPVPIMS